MDEICADGCDGHGDPSRRPPRRERPPYVPRRAALHLRGAERKVPASLLTVLLERPSK